MKKKSGLLLYCTISLIFFFVSTSTAQRTNFKCSSRTTCDALVSYVPINATTYSEIKTLFGVKNLRSIFGANGLPLTTSPNQTVAAQQMTKIPFTCVCNNGTGVSSKPPIYTVKPDDGLDFIARTVFSALTTYQQIADFNNITDANLIEIGQKLIIPLTCSCDDVDGMKVVHYGFLVQEGSTIEQIAGQFEANSTTLLALNNMTSPDNLTAGSVLDVPLRACMSSINTTSLDYPLLVPNGTYTFTANNCIRCACQKSNNWILQCEPSVGVKTPNWPQCPPMQCGSNNSLLSLGNTSSNSCGLATCTYTGYTKQSILTSLVSDSSCTPNGGEGSPSNYATKVGSPLQSSIWLLVTVALGLLC